jgi:hypothetical protein
MPRQTSGVAWLPLDCCTECTGYHPLLIHCTVTALSCALVLLYYCTPYDGRLWAAALSCAVCDAPASRLGGLQVCSCGRVADSVCCVLCHSFQSKTWKACALQGQLMSDAGSCCRPVSQAPLKEGPVALVEATPQPEPGVRARLKA